MQERERMTSQLREVPFLEPYPSASNFVLCKVVGRDAKDVKDALAKQVQQLPSGACLASLLLLSSWCCLLHVLALIQAETPVLAS